MSVHTPGPWKQWGYQIQVETKNVVGWNGLTMPETVAIGSAFKQTKGAVKILEQDACYANARLMAAAPDMLAALECAAEEIEDQPHDQDMHRCGAADMIFAAIKKAGGTLPDKTNE